MKKVKKIISVLLIFTMLLPLCITANAAGIPEQPFPDSAFYEIGDYKIHYRLMPSETDEHNGRFVLLHGFLGSTISWEPLSERLTLAGYDCLLVDLPNFGYSTRENAEVEAIPREEIVASLMQEIAPGEKWYVAGHSMGTTVAMNIACQYPELVEALLIFAGTSDTKNKFTNMPDSVLQAFGRFYNIMFKMVINLASSPVFGNRIMRNPVYDVNRDFETRLRYLEPLKSDNTGMGILFMRKRSTPLDFDALKQLEMPVLLCVASYDAMVPNDSDNAIRLKNSLPDHTAYYIMPDSTHSLIESKPDETFAVTIDFITGNL